MGGASTGADGIRPAERRGRLARVQQEIRFCAPSDEVRLAYTVPARGHRRQASNWLTHLELDWESGV
jgi:hypothetical protein